MKKNSLMHLGLIAVLAVGLTACSTGTSTKTSTPTNPVETITEAIIPSVIAQNENFTYEMYSAESFNELKGKEAFAVFVHSKSCGTCAKKNKQIISEVEQFTSGKILKMEYDEAPQKFIEAYEVTKYDTFVMFDAEGNHETQKGANVADVRAAL